ncbi:MAG: phosphoribosyltransferase family protein [bacterium]
MLRYILQMLYPSTCASCKQLVPEKLVFCPACVAQIKPVVSLLLPINKTYTLPVHAAASYEEPIRTLILRKFSEDINANRQLANIMLDIIPSNHLDADFIIPIPLHWRRYAYRGFNQAHEMARVISKKTNTPIINLLGRKTHTQFQSRLTKKEKQENVKNVFSIHWKYKLLKILQKAPSLENKKIIIIDDLCTTGETLKNAAQIIAHFKPASISAIVACRRI